MFLKDVRETYEKLRGRARELAEERARNPEGAGVETIQLQAVEPGTSINIQVPPPNSDDSAIQNARSIFESFPPGLQRALESGNLDEVNKVLGKMSVEEAEEVVEKLGEVCTFYPVSFNAIADHHDLHAWQGKGQDAWKYNGSLLITT